ncbi:gamma-glutamyltransferase [Sulfolobales archaeon HS-7]|nr:gamma-glutamyltransferase [Sulfolobales archaeon HS-7]
MPVSIGKKTVTSQSPLATLAGIKILEMGGNAFDAAIAVSAVLGVVLPSTSGIGGDGFMLAKSGGDFIAYNGSGWSPKAAREVTEKGVNSITIPGLVDMWSYIYDNYCTLSLEQILKPAISLAVNGFPVSRTLNSAIINARDVSEELKRKFGKKRFGDVVRLPSLGLMLKRIAKDPRDFYEGEIAQNLVEELNRLGGSFELSDFSEYTGEIVKPITSQYKDWEVYELPPNSQGITTLEMLKMIEMTGINKLPYNDLNRINNHVKIAISAYSDRDSYVADLRFSEFPAFLLSEDYLRKNVEREGIYNEKGKDTTFFAVGDGENNIGFIQSLFEPFGSGIMVNDIIFQNRGAGFTSGKNKLEPRKRPLHTLSIMYAENGKEELVIGCAAGHLRPQVHSQVLEYYVDYSMEIDEAVNAPRFVYYNGKVVAEKRLNIPATQVEYFSGAVGVVQAMKRKDNVYISVADSRSEGIALSL